MQISNSIMGKFVEGRAEKGSEGFFILFEMASRSRCEPLVLGHVGDDPFGHFAQEYIMSGCCRGMPTLEIITEAWENLDAEQQAFYILKAHKWREEHPFGQQQSPCRNSMSSKAPRREDDSDSNDPSKRIRSQ